MIRFERTFHQLRLHGRVRLAQSRAFLIEKQAPHRQRLIATEPKWHAPARPANGRCSYFAYANPSSIFSKSSCRRVLPPAPLFQVTASAHGVSRNMCASRPASRLRSPPNTWRKSRPRSMEGYSPKGRAANTLEYLRNSAGMRSAT